MLWFIELVIMQAKKFIRKRPSQRLACETQAHIINLLRTAKNLPRGAESTKCTEVLPAGEYETVQSQFFCVPIGIF